MFEVADLMAFGTLSYKDCALAIIWGLFLFEQYLSFRQYRCIRQPNPPRSLEHVKEVCEQYPKSRAYSTDKAKYAVVTALLSVLTTTLYFRWDAFPWLWDCAADVIVWSGYSVEYEKTRSIVFMIMLTLLGWLILLPQSLYYQFVLEERYGFNNMTLALYVSDTIKGFLVAGAIFIPVLALVLTIIERTGDVFYFYLWLFILAFNLLYSLIFPTLIQPLFNTFNPLPEGELRDAIERLAQAAKFPLTKLFVVDGSRRSAHSNAYYYGFFNQKRIVLFDTLIEQADRDEIVAVVGHELGHWFHSHSYKMLAVAQTQIFVVFFLFSWFVSNRTMYEAFGFLGDDMPPVVGFLLFQLLFTPIDSVVMWLMNVLSRHHEFQADRYAKLRGYAAPLRSGLIKLQLKNLSNLNNDPWYSAYHFSHPSLPERLMELEKTD